MGSIINEDNITKDTFETYSQSPAFKPFSPNIPFSVIAKRNSPPSLTTGSLRTLTTDHLHHIKTLGKIATPRTVSFEVATSTNFNAQEAQLSSLATPNPYIILSDKDDNAFPQDENTSHPHTGPTPNTNFTSNSTPHLIPDNHQDSSPNTSPNTNTNHNPTFITKKTQKKTKKNTNHLHHLNLKPDNTIYCMTCHLPLTVILHHPHLQLPLIIHTPLPPLFPLMSTSNNRKPNLNIFFSKNTHILTSQL